MEYVECLEKSGCSFDWGITGEEAAKQLGFSRLFASAYEEMSLHAKARQRDQERVRRDDIIPGFEAIVGEEQAIDQLLTRKERHAAAIAYLRALQNGDVVFPTPKHAAPPQLMLIYLMSNNAGVMLNVFDPVFAGIYRNTREFMITRLKQTDAVSVYELIGEFRRLIVESAASPHKYHSTDLCERGTLIGQLTVMSRVCPTTRPSEFARSLSEEISQQPEAVSCQNKAGANLQTEIESMPSNVVDQMCGLLEQQLRSGR
jgi:hypothetical protein